MNATNDRLIGGRDVERGSGEEHGIRLRSNWTQLLIFEMHFDHYRHDGISAEVAGLGFAWTTTRTYRHENYIEDFPYITTHDLA